MTRHRGQNHLLRYHLNGQRATESITVNGTLERDITYTYDDAESVWCAGKKRSPASISTTAFDASGNLTEVSTDDRSLDHTYTYLADGRIASVRQRRGAQHVRRTTTRAIASTWDEAGTIHRYAYDDADRVGRGDR